MESNVSRPRVPGQQQYSAPAHASAPSNGGKKRGGRFNVLKVVFSLLFISMVILSLALLVFIVLGGGKSEADLIKKDQFQAVFLNDQSGQVYFGKLTVLNARHYKLTDIYYVRVENAVQPDKTQTAQQNISLAKLGSELHGPEDEMFIARDQVLFWENLKGDGQVAKAIEEYKKTGGKANTNTDTTTPATNR